MWELSTRYTCKPPKTALRLAKPQDGVIVRIHEMIGVQLMPAVPVRGAEPTPLPAARPPPLRGGGPQLASGRSPLRSTGPGGQAPGPGG